MPVHHGDQTHRDEWQHIKKSVGVLFQWRDVAAGLRVRDIDVREHAVSDNRGEYQHEHQGCNRQQRRKQECDAERGKLRDMQP